MQPVKEKVEILTKELLKRSSEIKHGKVSVNLDIHNGRITSITGSTTLSVKDYLNEELIQKEDRNDNNKDTK